eukprot:scaffold41212_cov189-Skeletonema_dohrnii-CCMP3373.AAC.1
MDPLPQPLSNSAFKVKPLSSRRPLSSLQPNVAKAVPTLDSPTLSSISCTSRQPDKHRHFIHNRSLHTRSNRGCML